MRDLFDDGTIVGYCSNVVGAATPHELTEKLIPLFSDVRARVCADEVLPIGLWLPAPLCASMVGNDGERSALRAALGHAGLSIFTMNAFPFGAFHDDVVKKRVYTPDWSTSERLDYTIDAARLLAELIEKGDEGSVSTLPLGWRDEIDDATRSACAANLLRLVDELRRIEERTGRLVHVDIEPEPGCALDRAADVVELFDTLRDGADEPEAVTRYLRVCHDVCHSAVMLEDQEGALRAYADAGVRVGKVQLSSALHVDFGAMHEDQRMGAVERLRSFAEERYLHQTIVRTSDGETRFFDDLPDALDILEMATDKSLLTGTWRTHFHMPLFVDSIGPLKTTNDQIGPCVGAARDIHGVQSFEVETYAWSALPEGPWQASLAGGIAEELQWIRSLAKTARAS